MKYCYYLTAFLFYCFAVACLLYAMWGNDVAYQIAAVIGGLVWLSTAGKMVEFGVKTSD